MEPIAYLQVVRRRRALIICVTMIGLVLGFVTAPSGDQPETYEATHTLLSNPTAARLGGLSQATLLATAGEVPRRAAERLGVTTEELAGKVQAIAADEVSALQIVATDVDPARAEEIANALAEELLGVLASTGGQELAQARQTLLTRINDLNAQIGSLNEQITSVQAGGGDAQELAANRDGLSGEYRLAVGALTQLESETSGVAELRTLERASARPAGEDGLQAPEGRASRTAILGVMGLVLGLGLAFALERFDTRLRVKDDAERSFGLPVLAEIPPLARGQRHRSELHWLTAPGSPYVEAHRSLRSVLLFHWAGQESPPSTEPSPSEEHRVLLVVSPGPGEGKTSTVAHLAAAFAEIGKSVLVISADFRRPRVHALLGVEESPGISEAVVNANAEMHLIQGVRETNVPGVRLVPSGSPSDNPAELLGITQRLMRSARPMVDVVIVDSPPLLVVNDAIELSAAADTVIMLGRAGKTHRASGERAAEALQLVAAPVLGAALVGTKVTTAGNYYRSQYYSRTAAPSRSQRVFGRILPGRHRTREETSLPSPSAPVPRSTQASDVNGQRHAVDDDAVDAPSSNGDQQDAGASVGQQRKAAAGSSIRGRRR